VRLASVLDGSMVRRRRLMVNIFDPPELLQTYPE
jgi:hypothetical protein